MGFCPVRTLNKEVAKLMDQPVQPAVPSARARRAGTPASWNVAASASVRGSRRRSEAYPRIPTTTEAPFCPEQRPVRPGRSRECYRSLGPGRRAPQLIVGEALPSGIEVVVVGEDDLDTRQVQMVGPGAEREAPQDFYSVLSSRHEDGARVLEGMLTRL